MFFGRHAPTSVAIAIAVVALGFTFYRERVHGAEIQSLTREIAAMHRDLTSERAAVAAPPGVAYALQADQLQAAVAGGVAVALARSSASAAAGAKASGAAEPPQERTADQEIALASAGDKVDALVRKGGPVTPDELTGILSEVAAAGASDETDALRSRIARAINMGTIVLER